MPCRRKAKRARLGGSLVFVHDLRAVQVSIEGTRGPKKTTAPSFPQNVQIKVVAEYKQTSLVCDSHQSHRLKTLQDVQGRVMSAGARVQRPDACHVKPKEGFKQG